MNAFARDMTPAVDLTRHKGSGPSRSQRPAYVDLLPPCNAACPAGEGIQAWLGLAQAGKYRAAWEALVRDNPLPTVHGRVCYHPCETSCNGGELALGQEAKTGFLGKMSEITYQTGGTVVVGPYMMKIAGELTSTVFHVAARSLATSALSIFGDHSDIMAVRTTGFTLISSGNVQEAHDTAPIAEAATLEARVPFLHFFDGFRTSHELNTLEPLGDDDLRATISNDLVRAHRARGLNPEHPFIRGTAQNPNTFFQAREAVSPYYAAVPGVLDRAMARFAAITGRPCRRRSALSLSCSPGWKPGSKPGSSSRSSRSGAS